MVSSAVRCSTSTFAISDHPGSSSANRASVSARAAARRSAYDATLRRAELVALQVTDLFIEMHGDASLLVRRSKTDTEGRGETVYLARDTVRLVRVWLERSGVTDGRLFRSVHKCGALGERLDPMGLPRLCGALHSRINFTCSR